MHRFSGLFQFFLCPICWQAWYSTGSHIIAEKDATVTYYAEFRKRLQPYLLIYGFWQNINLARIIQSSEKAAAFSADIRLPAEYQYGLYYTEFRKCCSRLILFGFQIRLRTALIIQSSEKGCSRLTLFGFHSSFQIRLRTAPIIQSSAKAARLVMYWTQLRKACGRLVR